MSKEKNLKDLVEMACRYKEKTHQQTRFPLMTIFIQTLLIKVTQCKHMICFQNQQAYSYFSMSKDTIVTSYSRIN